MHHEVIFNIIKNNVIIKHKLLVFQNIIYFVNRLRKIIIQLIIINVYYKIYHIFI